MPKRSKHQHEGSQPSNKQKRARSETNDHGDYDGGGDAYVSPTSRVAEVGIIERVSLKNFMCHNQLDVKFGSHVNFVIGRNGSGKSAILTAIVVGLGGKATATNRGSAVSSFIKNGKQTATVEITLKNQGPDAYKASEYGESIITERRLSIDGSSQYKIKSEKGHVLSTKRDELSTILERFNIQADNPVAILNQDTSRNFLHSVNNHDKYKFFLKATQLEQMSTQYNMAVRKLAHAREMIEHHEKTLPTMETKVLKLEQKFKALDAVVELKDKIDRLKKEMCWSLICQRLRELEPFKKELTQEEATLLKIHQKGHQIKEKVDALSTEYATIQTKLADMNSEVAELRPQYVTEKEQREEIRAKLKAIQVEIRKVDGKMKIHSRDRDQILERINQLSARSREAYEEERRQRYEKINALNAEISSNKAQIKTTDIQITNFTEAINKYEDDHQQLKFEENSLESRRNNTQRDMKKLKDTRTNKLKKFGDWAPKIRQIIRETSAFHATPRGPIGDFIQLRDVRWALSAEICIKGVIDAYCVTDSHDEKLLEQIFEKYISKDGQKPAIITSAFRDTVYDVSGGRAIGTNHPTVMDTIICEDPVVMNNMIDQRGIERVILVESEDECMDVMMDKKPKRCHEAFTMDGTQIYNWPSLRRYPCRTDKAFYLSANVKEDILCLERQRDDIAQQIKVMHGQMQDVRRDMQQNKAEQSKAINHHKRTNERIRKLTSEIRELENVEDSEPADLATLEDELKNAEEQIVKLSDVRTRLSDSRNDNDNKLQLTDNRYQELDEKVRQLMDTMEPLKCELDQKQNDQADAKDQQKQIQAKVTEQEKKIKRIQRRIETDIKEIEGQKSKVLELTGQEIITKRKREDLQSEIKQIEKRVADEEREKGDPDVIMMQYHEHLEIYKHSKSQLHQTKHFEKVLRKLINDRQVQYAKFRQMIGLRAKLQFIVLLGNINYTGQMVINHEKETIDLKVQPLKNQSNTSKDIKSLSGGERSFSTVCFLLSLWDTVQSPIRCLDEFDVFMDMVTRRVSMGMMLDAANKCKSNQYIFLTPQQMSNFSSLVKPKIFRMPDPDRGQNEQNDA